MAPDDDVPANDPLAESARRALQRMADADAVDVEPWSAVNRRGRRRRQLRVGGAIAASVIVLAAGTAVVANAAGTQDHVSVSGPNATTTSAPADTSTSSSAPPTTPPTAPGGCVGGCGTIPLPPPASTVPAVSSAPGPTDLTGTLAFDGHPRPTWSMALGGSVELSAIVRNVTDHRIDPSSSLEPTSIATVCTSASSGAQTLWFMTPSPMNPGETAGRGGTFVPTDPYLGVVRCAVDIVTTDPQGTTFDTGAGGDMATATILAEVTAIAPVTITVQDQPATTTTMPTATTVPDTTTTTAP